MVAVDGGLQQRLMLVLIKAECAREGCYGRHRATALARLDLLQVAGAEGREPPKLQLAQTARAPEGPQPEAKASRKVGRAGDSVAGTSPGRGGPPEKSRLPGL
ncbi:MAG TPA: hypothetical protein VFB34_08995 [Chloroflexota bacterium]|nr:hypothetical protein [Chloroflexota bacterium]